MQFKRKVGLVWVAMFACAGLLFVTACSDSSSSSAATPLSKAQNENRDLLWSASDLQREMNSGEDLLIIDCRNKVGNSSSTPVTATFEDGSTQQYRQGEIYAPYYVEHIKGAYYLNFFLLGDPYYPAAGSQEESDLIDALQKLGIEQDTKICLYDQAISNPQGKVFFHFERMGLTNVHILDGGFQNWKDKGCFY